MSGLPTGTVTFLFTDMEGSTELLQRLGDYRYGEILEEHRRLLRAAFSEGGGHEIDTQGDAFFVSFQDVRDAVAAVVAAQRAITAHPWPADTPVRVRMALHTGTGADAASRYVGLDVHRAARICAAGHGGQILLSLATAALIEHALPPGTSLRDLGSHRLKDLQQPEKVFQLLHPDLPADFLPLKSLDAFANNLPHQLTSFIGREQEMVEVKRLLSTTCLLTLAGAGGTGKTRLALQVATDVLEEYPDGVWLVELAALADPALVPQTVAAALGAREVPGRPLLSTLLDYLYRKKLLLVMDNCEHLMQACTVLIEAMLRTCPNLRILATSREVLDIPGEVVWRVPSLSLPDPGRLPPTEILLQSEAVRLFVERAAAARPAFTLTPQNASAVTAVVQRLDGIPLAIELAAARVPALSVEQIATRLDDRFRLLTRGGRTSLPRHQTLQAAFDWSYHLLEEPERAVLRRLAVFAGGWTLEAGEAVCAGDGVEPLGVLDLLTQLVFKSWVLMDEQEGDVRYRFLETVRQYSLERLRESGEAGVIRQRHQNWYLAQAEKAEPELTGSDQGTWLNRLEVEHDNIRAALEWSMESGVEPGLRLASALWRFWYVRGYSKEGRGWLEALLKASSGAPPVLRAQALAAAGNLAVLGRSDYAVGRSFCEESLAIWRELGDRQGIAVALSNLGLLASDHGDHASARALCEESLTIRRELGDKQGVAISLNNLGVVAYRQGDYVAACTLFHEGLAIFRELKNRQHVAMALTNLGLVTSGQSDYALARSFYAEGLAIRRELGDKRGIAYSLEGFAGLTIAQGQPEQAARLLGAADTLREAIGVPLPPADRAEYERTIAAARSRLGEAAFAAAWAEGRVMTLEQAVGEALRC